MHDADQNSSTIAPAGITTIQTSNQLVERALSRKKLNDRLSSLQKIQAGFLAKIRGSPLRFPDPTSM